jgi:predicted permease
VFRNLVTEIRYALRTLVRSPGFAAAAIVTVALGVGVNTGIFTVLNGVLLRDLGVPDGHELVSVYQTIQGVPERVGGAGRVSTSEYREFSERAETLSGMVGLSQPWQAVLGGDAPQRILGLLVTCRYFEVLQQAPVLGRGLVADECEPGADPVVVLGYDLWRTAFDADPAVVGQTIELSRQLFTVVGVASEGTYGGLYGAQYFAPIATQPLLVPGQNLYADEENSWLFLVGRRVRGTSLEQVRAELRLIAARMDQRQPGRATLLSVDRASTLLALPPFLRNLALGAGGVVMLAFGLILLIACANVANLLLARATVRSREIALRLSLGASRARIIRQLLTESVLISLAGGVLGSVLALWIFQSLVTIAVPSLPPPGFPAPVFDPSPDFRVLGFALALTLAAGVLFGLAPALQVSRPDLQAVIRQDGSGTGQSRRRGRLQGTLVGVQVALCMALMIGAGLLLRGLYATRTVDPGFDYPDAAYVSYDLENVGYGREEAAAFRRRLMDEVRALPGVERVAYAAREPLGDDMLFTGIRLPVQDERETRVAELNLVSPDYFSLIGTPIVRGRTFTAAEVAGNAAVGVVTESTARNLWPAQDPIGQTLVQRLGSEERAVQVVGVARDAQLRLLGTVDPYYVYSPTELQEVLLVRHRSDYAPIASAIQGVARAIDPSVALSVSPLEANLDWWRGLSGTASTLAAALGALALALAAVGIYGIVSYFVERRTREMGIRVALGAESRALMGLILRRTMRPVMIGASIGVGAAVLLSGALSSVLFGVSPLDPLALVAATASVLGVSLVAAIVAGRPATQADPIAALHYE